MRVWERGSGETLACGTGACAAAVAAVENGYCKRGEDVRVILVGGELVIRYLPEGVLMTGPAEIVFEGAGGDMIRNSIKERFNFRSERVFHLKNASLGFNDFNGSFV